MSSLETEYIWSFDSWLNQTKHIKGKAFYGQTINPLTTQTVDGLINKWIENELRLLFYYSKFN